MLLKFVWIFNNDVRVIVSAHPYCALKYRKPSHVVSALGNKINNDKADSCLDLMILDVW